jgi:hypothetical protein
LTLTSETPDAWHALERELDLWRGERKSATLWWRDDDAQRASAQLDRLIELSTATSTPLVLATIPQSVDVSIPEKIKSQDNISIMQHGWSHENHAPLSEKKCELGDHRALEDIQRELVGGAEILSGLFDDNFLPILVPPWNRISVTIANSLKSCGYVGLSTFGSKPLVPSSPGFCQANTHVDLINWRKGRGFIGTKNALEQITSHLHRRRCGQLPLNEVTGILSHHLVHGEDLWQFLEVFFQVTSRHSSVQWQTGYQIFRV